MMGQPRATRNACQAEATRQKKQHSYLGWRGRGGRVVERTGERGRDGRRPYGFMS